MATVRRAFSGIVFAILFCLGLFFNRTQPLVPWIVCIATFVGAYEFARMAKTKGYHSQFVLACIASVLTVYDGYHYGMQHLPALLGLALLTSFVVQVARYGSENAVPQVSIAFFGCFYVSLPLALAMSILRSAKIPNYPFPIPNARFLITFVILTVWASDVGAYFIGRRWGRHKLAPTLSPGKSVEGMIGGFASTMLMAVFLKLIWPELSRMLWWPEVLGLAAVFCPVGLIGDLAESALKRDAGVKDSSTFNLTGHGGMLDILDSLLFCLPVFYLHCQFLYPRLHGM
ncbi:MAG: phosphatidate cytidylyltransferase [Candidatus Sumerlaeota bacterium]|nr:phosphatidate cytidylyltransferase [Candidatus Sumerlaeota bacterium]